MLTVPMDLFSIRTVVSNEAMVTRWVYPSGGRWRFWDFTQADAETEKWCRFFGFGREVTEPGIIKIGDTYYVHPRILEQIQPFYRRSKYGW